MPSLKLIMQPHLSGPDQVVVLVTASDVDDCIVEIVVPLGVHVDAERVKNLGPGSFSQQIVWPVRIDRRFEPAAIEIIARAGRLYQHALLPLQPPVVAHE